MPMICLWCRLWNLSKMWRADEMAFLSKQVKICVASKIHKKGLSKG